MVGKSAGKLFDWKNKTHKTEGEWGFKTCKTLESGTTWVNAVENIEGAYRRGCSLYLGVFGVDYLNVTVFRYWAMNCGL